MSRKEFRLSSPCTGAVFLEMFADGTREWQSELRAVTPEMLQWQPVPDGYSIGAIMLHMMDAESWWIQEVGDRRKRPDEFGTKLLSSETDVDGFRWPVPPAWSFDQYLDLYHEIRAETIQTVGTWKDLHEMRDLDIGGLPHSFSLGWILHHVVTHDSYHGGQIVMLRELYDRLA